MKIYRILIILFLLISLTACGSKVLSIGPTETPLPTLEAVESAGNAVNIIEDYGLNESSRVVLSELHLASGEEQSSYQPVATLEDSAVITRLVNSLDQPLELMAAARCPAKGLLGFYAGENLLAEFGLGCELQDIFFLSDLKTGEHYRPSAEFLETLQELLILNN